jgi:hypothetical protein
MDRFRTATNSFACDNPPSVFLQVLILRDFKSSNSVSVDCTGDGGHFSVSVHFERESSFLMPLMLFG